MSYFAVLREAGPAWNAGGIADQPATNDHAAFMSALADQGFVLFAGPLAGTEHGRLRALLIVTSATEVQIQRRFADDPWAISNQLKLTRIEPWKVLVGAEQLASARPAAATSD